MKREAERLVIVTESLGILGGGGYVSGSDLHTLNIAKGFEAKGFHVAIVVLALGGQSWSFDKVQKGHGLRYLLRCGSSDECDPELAHNLDQVFRGAVVLVRQMTARFAAVLIRFRAAGAKQIMLQIVDAGLFCARGILVTGRGKRCQGPLSTANCMRCAFSHRNAFLNVLAGGVLKWNLAVPRRACLAADKSEWASSRAIECSNVQSVLDCCDVLAFQSQAMRNVFIANGVRSEKTVMTITGTTPARAILAHERPGMAKQLIIGYAGQIESHKGFHILYGAAKRLNRQQPGSVKLIVASRKSQSGYNKQWFSTMQTVDWVEQQGYDGRDGSQVDHWHRQIHLLCVPSVWIDNRPNVALEALARSTPLVCPDYGCFPEIVESGVTGYFYQDGSEENLFRLLKRFHDQPSMITSLCTKSEGWGHTYLPTVEDEVDSLLTGFQGCS